MSYEEPGILGSMCTSPLEFANKIFAMYLHKNLGDPGLWLGTWAIEKDVVKMIGKLLNDAEATGFLVTGGTEANIIAMKTARDGARFNGRQEIIVPASAHASFDKSADLMRLKVIKVPLSEDYTVDIEGVEEAISKNTVAIVGIAGSTSLGTIDNIEKLSEIAIERGIYLHVDAAFGGFVIPFLNKMGYFALINSAIAVFSGFLLLFLKGVAIPEVLVVIPGFLWCSVFGFKILFGFDTF